MRRKIFIFSDSPRRLKHLGTAGRSATRATSGEAPMRGMLSQEGVSTADSC
jgi:hypothetical protein